MIIRRHGLYVWGDSWQQAKVNLKRFKSFESCHLIVIEYLSPNISNNVPTPLNNVKFIENEYLWPNIPTWFSYGYMFFGQTYSIDLALAEFLRFNSLIWFCHILTFVANNSQLVFNGSMFVAK